MSWQQQQPQQQQWEVAGQPQVVNNHHHHHHHHHQQQHNPHQHLLQQIVNQQQQHHYHHHHNSHHDHSPPPPSGEHQHNRNDWRQHTDRKPYPDAFIANRKKGSPSFVPPDEKEIEADYQQQQESFTPGCPPRRGRRRHEDVEDPVLRDSLLKGNRRGREEPKLADNYNFIPHGMRLHEEFITNEEEEKLLLWVEKVNTWEKHLQRRTQQYGYKFAHLSSSLVPADEGMPLWVGKLFERAMEKKLIHRAPNQLIVNEYLPGQGINSHSDQHCFEDDIFVISLGSPVTMNWTNGSDYLAEKFGFGKKETVQMVALPRSLVTFTSMARWRWQHAIPGTKNDIDENGKTFPRSKRVSLTFRYVDPHKWQTRVNYLQSGENSITGELERQANLVNKRRPNRRDRDKRRNEDDGGESIKRTKPEEGGDT